MNTLYTNDPPERWIVKPQYRMHGQTMWLVVARDTLDSLEIEGAFSEPDGVRSAIVGFGWTRTPTRWFRFQNWFRNFGLGLVSD